MRFSKRVEFVRRLVNTAAKPKLLHALEKLGPLQSARILRQLPPHDLKIFFETFKNEPFLNQILLEFPPETLPPLFALLEEPLLLDIFHQMPPNWVWGSLKQFPA
ncbi:MAG: hypothetical protein Q8P84_08500, partial [Deltaproteobacteria bacterium]|nr:hypothetical protein [Deltaproteobacteria bacterium]